MHNSITKSVMMPYGYLSMLALLTVCWLTQGYYRSVSDSILDWLTDLYNWLSLTRILEFLTGWLLIELCILIFLLTVWLSGRPISFVTNGVMWLLVVDHHSGVWRSSFFNFWPDDWPVDLVSPVLCGWTGLGSGQSIYLSRILSLWYCNG